MFQTTDNFSCCVAVYTWTDAMQQCMFARDKEKMVTGYEIDRMRQSFSSLLSSLKIILSQCGEHDFLVVEHSVYPQATQKVV